MTLGSMVTVLLAVLIFLMTVTLHEVAHGVVAYLRGDQTAKLRGRLTLNPFKHIDPFWTVIFPLFLYLSTGGRFVIGMAKPVPVHFENLRRPKQDMIWVALAGPAANIILAQFLLLAFRVSEFSILLIGIYFNLALAVFNLLPIPPLDGSRIVAGLLPKPLDREYLKIEPYGFLIVLLLYFTGLLYGWVVPGISWLAQFLGVPRIAF